MEIVSQPDPQFRDRRNDLLWLLTDIRGDFQDQATAYFLGHDRDTEGDDLAGQRLREIAKEHGLDMEAAELALATYRSLATPSTSIPRPHVRSAPAIARS
jgi:hypothetical protein